MVREVIMKMKATAALFGGIVLLLVAVFVIIQFFGSATVPIEERKINANEMELIDQSAVIYISTDAEKLEKEQVKGNLVFINGEGKTSGYEINPIEYGGTILHDGDLMIEQSDKMILSKEQTITTTFEEKDYRGMRAGFLPKSKQFYALYNSGLSDEYDYKMTIRYSDQAGKFESLVIPHFVSAAGEDGDDVLLLTQDLVSSEFQLKRVKLEKEPVIKSIANLSLPNTGNLDAVSQVLADEDAYYFAASFYESETNEDIYLFTIDRQTLAVKKSLMAQYRTEKETMESLPLTYNDSLHKWADQLYYVNGMGNVYRHDLKQNKSMKHFTLLDFPVANTSHAQIRFDEKNLYVIYVNKENEAFLDSYDLLTRERKQHKKIKGINKYLNEGQVITDLTLINKSLNILEK